MADRATVDRSDATGAGVDPDRADWAGVDWAAVDARLAAGSAMTPARTGERRVEDWALTDELVDSSPHARTLFNLSNGFLGIRGALEEDEDVADQALANGFYETWPISYPEDAYGLARVGQTIQPIPNPSRFTLSVNGVRLDWRTAAVSGYVRRLDLRAGVLTREFTWTTGDGIEVAVWSRRMVSFVQRGTVLMDYRVTVSADCDVQLVNDLVMPNSGGDAGEFDPRKGTAVADAYEVLAASARPEFGLTLRTNRAGRLLDCGVLHRVRRVAGDAGHGSGIGSTGGPGSDLRAGSGEGHGSGPGGGSGAGAGVGSGGGSGSDPDVGAGVGSGAGSERDAGPEEEAVLHPDRLSKVVAGRLAAGDSLEMAVLAVFATKAGRVRPVLDQFRDGDWEDLVKAQSAYVGRWWATADVSVGVKGDVQGRIRWNLFQALQASARADGLGIPAKGVSGSGYDGHYFWDGEALVLPYLTYVAPDLARRALAYRHATLDRARERARELHHRGAAFAWRTIDGREASAFFEAGTAQYHINADIAYAVDRYLRATGDVGYLAEEGVDLLVETARLWADLGFTGGDGRFHIHGVTGPDEYSALVDDNIYTNVMAGANLTAAAYWVGELGRRDPGAYARAAERLGLTDGEVGRWRRVAGLVALPYDSSLGVHGQDADFLSHRVWDFGNTPRESYPLLLHYHPLTIYRHQVCKQADLVLAMITRPDLFTPGEKRANFDYYDALTTGDSTLSASAQAIMAAETGRDRLAVSYFMQALDTDLSNSHKNSGDGVHVASAAAIWSILVMGFGGFRDYGGLVLNPRLPEGWQHLYFTLRIRDASLRVEITPAGTTLRLVGESPKSPIEVTLDGTKHTLTTGDAVVPASQAIQRRVVQPVILGQA